MATNKAKITDLIPDANNFNTGNEFGESLIEKSFSKFGAGRSILLDKNNKIIAGNKSTQKFVEGGGQNVIIVDSDGETLVAVRRNDIDLDTKRGREMALADNATAKANISWDESALTDWEMPTDDWGLHFDDQPRVKAWEPDEDFSDDSDGIEFKAGYRLSSMWYGISSENEVRPYMLDLPNKENVGDGATVKLKYSRTNATATERIIKTYMRPGDSFFEQCCGWMTFSASAKYFGFSGKGCDIWDTSLAFCEQQIKAMPGDGMVEVIEADCRNTGELSNQYDFVHSNPPFFNLEPYGAGDNDLASQGSYDCWLDAMGDMGKEAERILKPGGLANFVINDTRDKGVLVPMHIDFIKAIQTKSDLVLHDLVIAEVMSQALRFRKHDYERRRTVKCHEYIITFKKS